MSKETAKALVVLFLFTAIEACGSTSPSAFRDAEIAYQKGDYPAAFRQTRQLAEQGDSYAQYNLGVMYANGEGTARDYKEAAGWFRKAAVLEEPVAQYNLAAKYASGLGVKQDYSEAAAWYRKAVEAMMTAREIELARQRLARNK